MSQFTVLIIEDEKVYLDILHGILQHKYRVLIAKNGEQGLQRLQGSDLPDLILLDVVMPGIDGYETCRRIKADPRTQDIPVVFLTARSNVEEESLGLSLGAVDYIAKPISPAVVLARIHTHLALRQAQLELRDHNQRLEEMVDRRTESLRQLTTELVLAEERERRRIAAQLHDGPAQRLALSKISLGRVGAALGAPLQESFQETMETLNLTLQELRTLMVEISPPALYELGLGPAVEWLTESKLAKQGIEFRVDSAESYADLPETTRVFLFQAIRELLINIVKHSQASRASVSINSQGDLLVIEVRDDGKGMSVPDGPMFTREHSGFGLFALGERIRTLGGTIDFANKTGTHITLKVPIRKNGEAP